MPRIPIVLQTAETDCGPACLTAMLRWHGHRVKLVDLRADMDPGRDGASGLVMRDTALRWGLPLTAQLIEPAVLADRIDEVPVPFLLHLSRQHYVIVDRIRPASIEVMDPAVGRRRLMREEITDEASGLVLVYDPQATDQPAELPAAYSETQPAPKILRDVLRAVRGELTHAGTLSLVLAVGGLALPVTTALIVDALVGGTVNQHYWLLIGMVLALTMGVFTWARNWVLATLQRRLAGQLSTDVATTLFTRKLRFFDRRSVGDLFGRVESAHAIHALLSVTLLGALLDALLTFGYIIALVVIAPPLAAVTGAIIALCLLVSGLVARRSALLRREEILVTADSSTLLVDSIEGMPTLRAYGAEHATLQSWSSLLDRRLHLTRSRARLNGLSIALLATMTVATPLVILVLAASPTLTTTFDQVTPGTALGLMALAAATLTPVSSLATQLVQAADLRPLVDRVQDLMMAEAEPTNGTDPGVLTGEIILDNVSFRHDRYGRDVLQQLNARISAGSTVCVLGPTGCGKSTLAQLIAGLHTPTDGRILVDGHDLNELERPAVRAQIGVVFQDSWAPAGTIRDAVLVSRTGFTDDDIWRALFQAQLAEDLLALPMGLDTRLGSGGRGLSGGQRQRLALARALLSEPKLLILDEPTSALDGDTERAIETALRQLNITRLIITHRLSVANDADQLWIMDDGVITEAGTPAELGQSDGWYASLLQAQPHPVSSQKLTSDTALG